MGENEAGKRDGVIEHFGRADLRIRTYGAYTMQECPVCRSADIRNIWRIPMEHIDPPATLFGGYFNRVPTLSSPFEMFNFDLCEDCESIFLNPHVDRQSLIDSYTRSTHYIKKMKVEAEWPAYEERYVEMLKYAPANAQVLVDAACGLGQILYVARRTNHHSWRRMVGLELSQAYVDNMRKDGIEAYRFDLDHDDQRAVIGAGQADFVSFFEAFEHVASPLSAVGKLLDLLRPGGRLYFTAQRYGEGMRLAVRPGEPIYIGKRTLTRLCELLRCKLIDAIPSSSRYFVILEKTHEQTPQRAADMPLVAHEEDARLTPPPEPARETMKLAGPFLREHGKCWYATFEKTSHFQRLLDMADANETPRRSKLWLFEDGEKLGPMSAPHTRIREDGKGAYSHWRERLMFSTPDDSDPNVNGRTYEISFPIE